MVDVFFWSFLFYSDPLAVEFSEMVFQSTDALIKDSGQFFFLLLLFLRMLRLLLLFLSRLKTTATSKIV